MGKFWLDSLVHDPKVLEYIVDLVGAERVAVGSDYPFPLGENIPGTLVKNSAFSTAQKELLLHGSALDWLGLPKANFC